jgi:hypothetical protein
MHTKEVSEECLTIFVREAIRRVVHLNDQEREREMSEYNGHQNKEKRGVTPYLEHRANNKHHLPAPCNILLVAFEN